MPRIQPFSCDRISATGGGSVPPQVLQFVRAFMNSFKPQNYGMLGLIRERRISASFIMSHRDPASRPSLAVAISYPPGTSRDKYLKSYECAGAALVCRRLVSEHFNGYRAPIAMLMAAARRYDHESGTYKDFDFLHYALDITGLLAQNTLLAEPLQKLGVLCRYQERVYLDPTPLRIGGFSRAEKAPEGIGTDHYAINFFAWRPFTWPESGSGICWSLNIIPPVSGRGPLRILLEALEVRDDALTGEGYMLYLPIQPDQWGVFSRIAAGADYNRASLEAQLEATALISPAMSRERANRALTREGLGIALEMVRILGMAMGNLKPQEVINQELAAWRPYLLQNALMSVMPANRPHVRNVGRNDPCPCGSGKKFKRCCGGD